MINTGTLIRSKHTKTKLERRLIIIRQYKQQQKPPANVEEKSLFVEWDYRVVVQMRTLLSEPSPHIPTHPLLQL